MGIAEFTRVSIGVGCAFCGLSLLATVFLCFCDSSLDFGEGQTEFSWRSLTYALVPIVIGFAALVGGWILVFGGGELHG